MKKIFSNFIYQAAYQFLLIVLPIITIPIVSKSLGVTGIGIYNYVNSITSYFILVAGLGLANYGIREIAAVRGSKLLLSKKFSELLTFNLIITILVTFVFLGFSLFFYKYRLYFLISLLSVGAAIFDISWFFAGIEDFKTVTLSNFSVKLVSFLLIILFIHSKNDLSIYFLIQCSSNLVSNIAMCFSLKGKIKFVQVSFSEAFSHLKPAFDYFYGKVAITLYTTLSKTILGFIISVKSVGLYSNSLQLSTIIVTLITSLDTVLMPRLTSLYESKKVDTMIKIIEKTFHLQLFFSIPAMFGLVLINNKLIPWFFGNEFSYLRYTVPCLAPIVVIIPLGTSVMRQYLMPKNEIKKFNFSVYIGAIVGLIFNFLLIPIIGIWGAIIATLLSEITVTYLRLKYLFQETSFIFYYNKILKYVNSSIIMFVVTYFITKGMAADFYTTLIQIILGGVIYLIVTILFRANPLVPLLIGFLKKGGSKNE